MLKELRIQNFAIIDQVEISFGKGLNIISGETGAGKSIIMDALLLILGGRASSDLIRKGSEEAIVEACFDVSGDARIIRALEDQSIPLDKDEQELIVKRTVSTSGKNRILINGSLANASILGSVTGRLIDLCSQHDQQLLSRPEEQLRWLDHFGGLEKLRQQLEQSFEILRQEKLALDQLSEDEGQRSQRFDFLQFQSNELSEARLHSAEEDTILEQEVKSLACAEQLFATATEAEELINGNESGFSISGNVVTVLQKIQALESTDPRLKSLRENLENIRLHASEASLFLRGYLGKVDHNERELESLQARLALLSKLKRKYGPSLADVIRHQQNVQQELDKFENHDHFLSEAKDKLRQARERFEVIAKEMTRKRRQAAVGLAASIEKELKDLQMDRARFEISLSEIESPSKNGLDAVEFLIATNPGEAPGKLQRIASGGELSRIMLALHNVVSFKGGVGVYLFDEVDAGIGGKTAAAVGAKIARVAQGSQVICITHLAQVASFADHHHCVEKNIRKMDGKERTFTNVRPLIKEQDKLQEIARMLSGLENDATALANAKAMRAKTKGKGATSFSSRGTHTQA